MLTLHLHHLVYMCTIDLYVSFMFEIEHLCSYRLLCCIILLELLYVCIKCVSRSFVARWVYERELEEEGLDTKDTKLDTKAGHEGLPVRTWKRSWCSADESGYQLIRQTKAGKRNWQTRLGGRPSCSWTQGGHKA